MANCTPCQTFNFDDRIITFCKGTDFRSYVRQAINDEMWWRDIFSKYNMADTIESKLNNKLPEHVRHEIANQLPAIFQARMDNYMLHNFPTQASREINTQMTAYINNSPQMYQILESHKATLKSLLEKTVHEIMTRIVSDPAYNQVVNSHITSINDRADQTIRTIIDNAGQQIMANNATFEAELSKMKKRMDSELSALRTELTTLAALKERVERMEKYHENEISSLKWLIGAVVVIPLTAYFIFYAAANKL